MAIEVVMPQMGESVAEGTVVRWIKKVRDHVERDEPLLEISTDKVDAEIPSPAAGGIAEKHHVDLCELSGTGVAGRITKRDVLGRIEHTGGDGPDTPGPDLPAIQTAAASSPAGSGVAAGMVKMSAMRKKIAEHMVL